MSVVAGPSNGEDTHAPDDSVEETEKSHCSTQTDEYGDSLIEPYLTAYYLGNLDAEHPGDDASFSKVDGTGEDKIEPYLVSYHFEVTDCEGTADNGRNGKEAMLSEDHTAKSRCLEVPLRNGPTTHCYTYIDDHDYTYIDNTSHSTQDVKEERGSSSITSEGLESPQTIQPLEETSQQEDQRGNILLCRLRHSHVATAIFVATLIIVGLLLVTRVLPLDLDKHAVSSDLVSENPMSTTSWARAEMTKDMKVSPIITAKSFHVNENPRTVTVSTSGRIAVAFGGGRRIGIYDSDGAFLLDFLTLIDVGKGQGKMTGIYTHDVSFGTLNNNNDVWIVGGDNSSHYIAQYDCLGNSVYSVAIPSTLAPRRLALNRRSTRAIVTETVRHRGVVKVFGLNGIFERSFGRRQGLMHPTGITVDSEDSILVADSSTAYIYVYRDIGQFLFKCAGKGTNNGQLSLPLDICTDSSRHIIVADSGNRRIELFTSRGEFIRHIATDIDPLSIAVGPDGQLVLTEASKKKEEENKNEVKGYQFIAMSVVAGPSSGVTYAPDDSQEETENSHGSTQTDEYGDGFIEPYLTAYHLGNLYAEHPGDDAPFSTVDGTGEDKIEPYLVSYHFEVTDCEGTADKGRNGKKAMLSEDHTAKSRCLEVPLRNDTPRGRPRSNNDILQDKESTQAKGHDDILEGPTTHCYTYIDDHDYTYIDNTSHSTQDVKKEPGSSSITSKGLESPQTIQPLEETSQQDDQRATAIFVATLIIVGLLLVTRVLPLDLDKNAVWSDSSSENRLSTTRARAEMTKDTKVTSTIAAKSLHVNGNPRTVTVSTGGRIAVAFGGGRRIAIYNSDGVFLLDFLTLIDLGKGQGKMTGTYTHDVSFGTLNNNNDVWIVGGDNSSHYIAQYDCLGNSVYSFAIPSTLAPRRLALNRRSTRAIVTETVRHRGVVKVFGFNGMLERSFGRRQGLMHPTGITVDSEDSILVVDSSTAYIYVYRDNGQFLFRFAGKGTNNGQFSLPLDICTDSSCHIIVADSGNRRIELFTSHGEFIRHIATDIDPLSIAMGPDGQLVLAEASKKKVTILTNY
ncbi:hypothetical protein Bbelb_160210 [Branchiostoma belcheri]|nr:hypothetical protein Bbelb_160210 [Branchiostoma belcheri]